MKHTGRYLLCMFSFVFCVTLSSCVSHKTQRRSSSMVKCLYHFEKDYFEKTDVPRLSLPLRVGVAFVPEDVERDNPLTERDKMELMKEVSEHFKKHNFVKSIELIPSPYLRRNGSFTNLDQIRTMYAVDVMALLSYDQTQFTDRRMFSITYWTIVGAYIIPGEKNDTHTMLDAAVYDIESRKMLFRAPGISLIKNYATPINLSKQLRMDSSKSFKVASKDLITNLDIQLELFKEEHSAEKRSLEIVPYAPDCWEGLT